MSFQQGGRPGRIPTDAAAKVFESLDIGPSGGDVRNLLLRPVGPTSVVGAIPVKDCQFINCEFFGLGFTGPDGFLDLLLALETK